MRELFRLKARRSQRSVGSIVCDRRYGEPMSLWKKVSCLEGMAHTKRGPSCVRGWTYTSLKTRAVHTGASRETLSRMLATYIANICIYVRGVTNESRFLEISDSGACWTNRVLFYCSRSNGSWTCRLFQFFKLPDNDYSSRDSLRRLPSSPETDELRLMNSPACF
jgi:hypothetical protein